jgi:glucose-1-phosphate adenylyltransferase
VGRGATIEAAILWDRVEIGAGAVVKRAIIEDGVKIPPNFHIGVNLKQDAKRFHVTDNGIVAVPNNVILEE